MSLARSAHTSLRSSKLPERPSSLANPRLAALSSARPHAPRGRHQHSKWTGTSMPISLHIGALEVQANTAAVLLQLPARIETHPSPSHEDGGITAALHEGDYVYSHYLPQAARLCKSAGSRVAGRRHRFQATSPIGRPTKMPRRGQPLRHLFYTRAIQFVPAVHSLPKCRDEDSLCDIFFIRARFYLYPRFILYLSQRGILNTAAKCSILLKFKTRASLVLISSATFAKRHQKQALYLLNLLTASFTPTPPCPVP